jgi:hypothetical protein
MPLTSPDSLSARLDRPERESRRWKRAALGSWVAIAALFLLGQSPPRPGGPVRAVEADQFVLRDARGRTGATLGRETDGTPRLALHDPAGRARATLAVGTSWRTTRGSREPSSGCSRMARRISCSGMAPGAGAPDCPCSPTALPR